MLILSVYSFLSGTFLVSGLNCTIPKRDCSSRKLLPNRLEATAPVPIKGFTYEVSFLSVAG